MPDITQEELHKYREAAEAAWDDDTRHEAYIGHPLPSAGQCYVTSKWLASKLGGTVGVKNGHYFWVSPERTHVIDLTGDQFHYRPEDLDNIGVPIDEDDESGWHPEPNHTSWRPGPVIYKKADHPLFKGFRVPSVENETPRAKRFAQRADEALDNPEAFRKQADAMGSDPYPAEEPQVANDIEQRQFHDEPGYNPGTYEYNFFYGNGDLHISPDHEHEQLMDHAGIAPDSTGPVATGHVSVDGNRATWAVESNVGLNSIIRILRDYTKQAGWKWNGATSTDGEPIDDHSYGPKKSMWYREANGVVEISEKPLPNSRSLLLENNTVQITINDEAFPIEAIAEWAEDEGYTIESNYSSSTRLSEYPGGGNAEDKMINRGPDGESLEQWNFINDKPTENDPKEDRQPNGTFKCPRCSQVFGSWATYMRHRRDEEPMPKELPEEDGKFPPLPDMDKPLPDNFIDRKPFVFPLASVDEAKRFEGFDTDWGISYDGSIRTAIFSDPVRYYGAYTNGQIVGYAAVGDPGEILSWKVRSLRVASAILERLLQHYGAAAYELEDERQAHAMERLGGINATGSLYVWGAGQEPKDLIQAEVPFIYDVKDDTIVVGHPGTRHSDIPGKFTPAGIIEGTYEPGGKVIIRSMTNMPYTVRHFADLWYWSHPQMEITGIELMDDDGGTTKLAGALDGFEEDTSNYPQGWDDDDEEDYYSTGECASWAVAHQDEYPHLRFGMHYERLDGDDARRDAEADGEDWNGKPVYIPQHVFTHDDRYAYDAKGTHPLPYNDWSDTDLDLTYDDIADTGMVGRTPSSAWIRKHAPIPKTSALASTNVGEYIKTLVMADSAAYSAYDALKKVGGEVYVVGGAVRDALMNRAPKDLDMLVHGIASDDVRRALEALPGRVDLTGKDFGVYRYRHKGDEVEIALPRAEKSTGDRRVHFDVQVDPNMPVEEDLLRRDFTVNAMAVDLDSGQLVDPYDGAGDIEKGTLKTVHPSSFEEDPTRLVRGLVAASKHNLTPDENTRHEMEENAHRLALESPDRLHAELDKLFSSPDPARAIRLAQDTGILRYILPEVAENFDYDQNNPHHHSSLGEHLLHVLDNVARKSDDPDLRLAALLHDVGKPASAWVNPETGSNHYYKGPDGQGEDHEHLGADMAVNRLRELRWPTTRINRIEHIIRQHMFPAFNSTKGARKFINRVGDENADDLLTFRWADQHGKGQTPEELARRTPVDDQRDLVTQVREANEPTDMSALSVNGNDLIALGLDPGPRVGEILRSLTNDVLEYPELNDRDTLLLRAQEYIAAQP